MAPEKCSNGAAKQAFTYWQTYNYWAAEAQRLRKPLILINLDETMLCLGEPGGKGLYFGSSAEAPGQAPRRHASLALRRTYLSVVSLICNDPALQAVLPQVVVGSKRTVFKARDFEAHFQAAPNNVYLVRGESSWLSLGLMKSIVDLLHGICQASRPDAAFIFIFDCCGAHLHPQLFRYCLRKGLWPLVVPTKMTWFLQPLDVRVFRVFKSTFRQRYQRRLVAEQRGTLDLGQFLEVLYDCMTDLFFRRAWPRAFEVVGLSEGQRHLSIVAQEYLGLAEAPLIPTAKPTDAQIREILPSTRPTEAHWFFDLPAPQEAVVAQPPQRRVLGGSAADTNILENSLPDELRHSLPPGSLTRNRLRAAVDSQGATPPADLPAASSHGSAQPPWTPAQPMLAAPAPAPPAAPSGPDSISRASSLWWAPIGTRTRSGLSGHARSRSEHHASGSHS